MKNKKQKSSPRWIFRLWSFGVVLLFLLFLPGQNYYETLQLQIKPPLVRATALDNFVPSNYPIKVGLEEVPTVSAEAVTVLDLESGVIFYTKNPNQRLQLASITKLMTALVALDYYKLDDILKVKRLVTASGESEMGLKIGDQVSVQNLVYGLLVPSGNDAAYTLADNFPGGIENFIYSMNNRAEQLHMKNTHFENPSGLDSQNHYSSTNDIGILARQALKAKLISTAVATYGITLTDITGSRVYTLKNVNQFLGYLYGADGVKTGFTDLAGQCLVASVSRNGHRVISVVLNSQNRFGESGQLIEWVYRNFNWLTPNDH